MPETDVIRKVSKNIIDIYDNLNIGEKINKFIYIEEEPFETLDIVEVAMNNDKNDFRKMKENLANKRNIILHHMKINMLVLSKMSKKTKHCLN